MPTLNWLTREADIRKASRVSYRLLEEVEEFSSGDRDTGNMLIQGDNLDALKALLPFFSGRVKCIYIDPPFNTGQAFDNYDDNMKHTIWLGLMYARFELLRDLLCEAGTIAIHLDDEELAYGIAMLDETFGRKNRVNLVTFRQGAAVGHKAINPGLVTVTNYIVIYAKDRQGAWTPNRVFTRRERDSRYASFIENFDEPHSGWRVIPLSTAFASARGVSAREAKKRLGDRYEGALNDFVLENADRVVRTARPDFDGVGQVTRDLIVESRKSPERVFLQRREHYSDIYLCNGERWLFYRDKLKAIDGERVPGEPLTNLWDDLLSNNLHNEGGVKFRKGKKPEGLVKRLLELYSDKGDLVLDSFLGSGTTAAVAHKMERRYIGIEMGDQAVELCVPRLKRVVEGEQGGISKSVGWGGGGGFRFFRLGAPAFDVDGRISPDIEFHVLAAHIWFSETGTPWDQVGESPFLGIHEGRALALLYKGVFGDKRPSGGNVLTHESLALIREGVEEVASGFGGPLTVYGEQSRLAPDTLEREGIVFKQTPYDVRSRV